MVSRLVSLWFTWFHPFLNWLDRDLFLRDMKSGDLKAQFCSPILVNAMLAVACVSAVFFPPKGISVLITTAFPDAFKLRQCIRGSGRYGLQGCAFLL